ncbi:MAG: DUF1566 domain-containing protein [Nitrospirae bacterium]|nr:DUF1566 domain-containing protein [Nitrospirota bacterium]
MTNEKSMASTVNLPRSGQTTCYDAGGAQVACAGTGQDGDIKAGVAWPTPRFTDNGDQTITDNLTGLIWAKDAGTPAVGACTGGKMAWTKALDYVACLNAANYLGYNDWRLPNINELESLVNAEQSSPGQWLATQGYTNVESDHYWSSTTYARFTSDVWNVIVWCGLVVNSAKSLSFFVWPVRTEQSGSNGNSAVWATGQKQSYYSGDDGAIGAGVAWPSPRFTNDGTGTVTDNLTGLTWTKNANPAKETKTWQQALDYVASMNTGRGTYGYIDWRLPNRRELRSLVDHSKYGSALPAGNPCTNVQNYYWSSSTNAGKPSYARNVNMYDGDVHAGYKAGSGYVWAVRGGHVGNLINSVISHSGDGGAFGSDTINSPDGKINRGSVWGRIVRLLGLR